MKNYKAALTMYVGKDSEDAEERKDDALERLFGLEEQEQVVEYDVTEDDEDYNIFVIFRVQARKLNVQTITNKLMKLLPNLAWDYHYIKGVDNDGYWQP